MSDGDDAPSFSDDDDDDEPQPQQEPAVGVAPPDLPDLSDDELDELAGFESADDLEPETTVLESESVLETEPEPEPSPPPAGKVEEGCRVAVLPLDQAGAAVDAAGMKFNAPRKKRCGQEGTVRGEPR